MMETAMGKAPDFTSGGGSDFTTPKCSPTDQSSTNVPATIFALDRRIERTNGGMLTTIEEEICDNYIGRLEEIEANKHDLQDIDLSDAIRDLLMDDTSSPRAMEVDFEKEELILPKKKREFYTADKADIKIENATSTSTSDEIPKFFLEDTLAPRAAKRARTDGSFEDYIAIKELPPIKRNGTSFTIVETTSFQLMVNRLHQLGMDATEVATQLYAAKSVSNYTEFIKAKAEWLAGHNDERSMFGDSGF